VAGLIFAETALFDGALGLIQNPIGAIPHFPTYFAGLILIALVVKEATSY